MKVRRALRFATKGSACAVALTAAAFAMGPRVSDATLLGGAPLSHAFVDRSGVILQVSLAADGRYRLKANLDDIEPMVLEATLDKEDRWFWRHPGVNPVALISAVVDTYVHDKRRGGSTVTMQLARLLSNDNTQTAEGKLRQIGRALWIEVTHTKREILEAYLTLAPYGGNIEGIEAAGWIWFGKPARALTAREISVLVSLPQDPRRAADWQSPALERSRSEIAARLRGAHPELTAADVAPFLGTTPSRLSARHARHFVASVSREVEPTEALVRTTLSLEAQRVVEEAVTTYLATRQDEGITNAAVLVAHRDGDVLSYVGSADFFGEAIDGQNNGVTMRRSPGSTLKPLVYALAIDAGLIHSDTLLVDEPTRFGGFNPENFDGQFAGPLPARAALALSRNVPAVDLFRRLPPPGLYGLLRAAGVALPHAPEHYGLSLALGGAEVSLEDLVALHAGLTRGGRFSPLRRRAQDKNVDAPLLTPEASALVLDMLRDAQRPVAYEPTQFGSGARDVSFKTGTSWGFRDAWTIGSRGDLIVGVWVGDFDASSNPALVGRTAAAPLFFRVLQNLEAVFPEQLRAPALDLVDTAAQEVQVCATTGAMPSPACPHKKRAWVVPGRSPLHTCDVHRAIEVEVATGLQPCASAGAAGRATKRAVVEVWPTSTLRTFAAAGLPRTTPPGFFPECASYSNATARPHIVSPQADVAYVIEPGARAARVPLGASVDGTARELVWFVDNQLAARGRVHEDHDVLLDAGEHIIRVVDDVGGSAATRVRVSYP